MIKLTDITVRKHNDDFKIIYTAKFNLSHQTTISREVFVASRSAEMESHVKMNVSLGLMNYAYGDLRSDIFQLIQLCKMYMGGSGNLAMKEDAELLLRIQQRMNFKLDD